MQKPCDFEDSGLLNRSGCCFVRNASHPWRPKKSLPQYHDIVLFSSGRCILRKSWRFLVDAKYFFVQLVFGGFLKWWYPTTMGCPTKNDYFGVFWGYHHLRKHPIRQNNEQFIKKQNLSYSQNRCLGAP